MSRTIWMLGVIAILTTSLAARAHPADEAPWSEASNGLQGRLSLELSHVSGAAGIVTTYLELRTVRGANTPLLIRVDGPSKTFRVTDSGGKEVAMPGAMDFSGWLGDSPNLVLPFDGQIRFRIGPTGNGLGGGHATHLDLGVFKCWSLPRDGRRYFLEGAIEIAREPERFDNTRHHYPWHGKLTLPRVEIPTSPPPIDPEKLGPRIQELGEKMLGTDHDVSEEAGRRLSLIDDPRVVPWYVRAAKSSSYRLREKALDRLPYLEGDDALDGIKIAARTMASDLDETRRSEVRISQADRLQYRGAIALSRSVHPDAKRLLLKLHRHPSPRVRTFVVQATATMTTPEARAAHRRLLEDPDGDVRQEAEYLGLGREEEAP